MKSLVFFSLHRVHNFFKCLDFMLKGLDIQGVIRDTDAEAGRLHINCLSFPPKL